MTYVDVIQSIGPSGEPDEPRGFSSREAADKAWTALAEELLSVGIRPVGEDGEKYWLSDWCEVTYMATKSPNPTERFYRFTVAVHP